MSYRVFVILEIKEFYFSPPHPRLAMSALLKFQFEI